MLAPLAVLTAPMPKIFVHAPLMLLVTETVMVQKPAGGMMPPASETLGPLLTAVTVPPQVVDAAGARALVICVGYVSVNAAPVSATALGLVSVMVTVLVCPLAMVAALKLLATVSAFNTVNVAFTPVASILLDAPVTRPGPLM